jgi:hypothetical protein
MLKKTFFGAIMIMFMMVLAGNAGELQEYFNNTANKVKGTTDPVQKREILSKSLQTMSEALDEVQNSSLISKEDRVGIDNLRATLRENQDELSGSNGYERVPDKQLNIFSDYVVQNMEQADKTITISVVTALLIVILIILIT